MADAIVSHAGAPVTMGPAGFWLDAKGDVAATDPQGKPQQTPGMRDNPQATIYYDAAKDLNYNLVSGVKVYQSPVEFVNGSPVQKTSLHGKPISDTGGGLVHGNPQWNPKDGKWDVGLDLGKVLSWAAGAGIAAPIITAAMGGVAATSAGGVGVGETGATAGLAGSGFGSVAPLASSVIAPTVAPTVVGGVSTLGAAGASTSAASTAAKVAQILGAAGKGVGDAATAAGNNRLNQEQLGLTANGQNIAGQSAYENELMNRAKEEGIQRLTAKKDLYRQSTIENPRVSPFNPNGPPVFSDAYKTAMAAQANQGSTKLATAPTYDTSKMPALKPYDPLNPKDVAGSTGTSPSTLAQVGEWASPALTTAQLIAKLFA